MARQDDRFEVIQSEGSALMALTCKVLLDKATGVQYLFVQNGYAGGLCPLIDRDGKPVSWEV